MKLREAIEQWIAGDRHNVCPKLHMKHEDASVDVSVWPTPNDDGYTFNVYGPDLHKFTRKHQFILCQGLLEEALESDEWVIE